MSKGLAPCFFLRFDEAGDGRDSREEARTVGDAQIVAAACHSGVPWCIKTSPKRATRLVIPILFQESTARALGVSAGMEAATDYDVPCAQTPHLHLEVRLEEAKSSWEEAAKIRHR